MTRLKWYQTIGGEALSTNTILIGNSFGLALIWPKSLVFSIIIDGETINKGKANSLSALKKKVKATLKELGTNFCDEIRNKGKTEKFEL